MKKMLIPLIIYLQLSCAFHPEAEKQLPLGPSRLDFSIELLGQPGPGKETQIRFTYLNNSDKDIKIEDPGSRVRPFCQSPTYYAIQSRYGIHPGRLIGTLIILHPNEKYQINFIYPLEKLFETLGPGGYGKLYYDFSFPGSYGVWFEYCGSTYDLSGNLINESGYGKSNVLLIEIK
jgi:hypothetical protein